MSADITLQVQRYQPGQRETAASSPYRVSYHVSVTEDTSVLSALQQIKEEQDPSLSFRWSCRMGICGSCGVMVNGQPKLGCGTLLRDYPQGAVIEPLAHFPVERDLIVDQSIFMAHLQAVEPYLQSTYQGTEPQRQTPAEVSRYRQYAGCINCGLCYSACPQFALNPDFLGPAALATAHRYNLDSRDQGKQSRVAKVNDKNGVWGCTFVGYCATVCPKGVDPAAAVNQGKVAAAQATLIGLFRG